MFAELTERECRNAIALEYDKAAREYPPFASLHEGWAVMQEEWEEDFRELSAASLCSILPLSPCFMRGSGSAYQKKGAECVKINRPPRTESSSVRGGLLSVRSLLRGITAGRG